MTGWKRSSFCAQGECIEALRADDGRIWLRSGSGQFSHVKLSAEEWFAFIAGVKAGEFDHLTDP
jgi:hypothetical protein